MGSNWLDLSLFITALLTGLYAGMGFFTRIGGNPAIQKMTASTFAEYWQHIDFYMAARMKFFGPVMLFSVIISAVLLYNASQMAAFWCLIAALLIIIADIVLIITTNTPLNKLIQSWDLRNLPEDVAATKSKVIYAFQLRSTFMIGSFICVLLGLFLMKH